jgi:predicted AAA+ superfamily ATPase
MRPMSLFESGHSSGAVSLSAMFDGVAARATDPGLSVRDIIERICIGGWPQYIGLDAAAAQRSLRGILDELVRVDIHAVDSVRRDPRRVARVLSSLARNIATQASNSVLAADTAGSDGGVDRETVRDYLAALDRLMILDDSPAWAPTLRSRAILRSAATRYFVDPCLAVAALRTSPAALLRDIEFVGLLFENLVMRDLRVYLQEAGAHFSHYRDSSGLEVDVVIELDDGRWAGIEVKLGSSQIDTAAANLRKFAEVVDTGRIGEPVFLGVVTATGYAYRRKDGVFVLPIGTLGP